MSPNPNRCGLILNRASPSQATAAWCVHLRRIGFLSNSLRRVSTNVLFHGLIGTAMRVAPLRNAVKSVAVLQDGTPSYSQTPGPTRCRRLLRRLTVHLTGMV